jgi:hypothetical protein
LAVSENPPDNSVRDCAALFTSYSSKVSLPYPKWLVENNVSFLLIDQLLNESSAGKKPPVDHKGHQVMAVVRKTVPDLPIYVVSRAALEDEDLKANWGDADETLTRASFLNL